MRITIPKPEAEGIKSILECVDNEEVKNITSDWIEKVQEKTEFNDMVFYCMLSYFFVNKNIVEQDATGDGFLFSRTEIPLVKDKLVALFKAYIHETNPNFKGTGIVKCALVENNNDKKLWILDFLFTHRPGLVNCPTDIYGDTPICYAICYEQVEVAKLLCGVPGIDLDKKVGEKIFTITPRAMGHLSKNPEISQLFTKQGYNVCEVRDVAPRAVESSRLAGAGSAGSAGSRRILSVAANPFAAFNSGASESDRSEFELVVQNTDGTNSTIPHDVVGRHLSYDGPS